MLVKTYSSTVFGINATTITIEVNLGQGINFFLVGLPDSAVKESHQRIKAAFKNNNFNYILRRKYFFTKPPGGLARKSKNS